MLGIDPAAKKCLPPKLPDCARQVTELDRFGVPAWWAVKCLDDHVPAGGWWPPEPMRPDENAGPQPRSASVEGGASGDGGSESGTDGEQVSDTVQAILPGMDRARDSDDKGVQVASAATAAAAGSLAEALGLGAGAEAGAVLRQLGARLAPLLLPLSLSGDTMQEGQDTPDGEDAKDKDEEKGKQDVVPQSGKPGREPPKEPTPPDLPPGIGHNRPPKEDDKPGGGIQDEEIRNGVTVRGDPDSSLWKRFTGAVNRIPGDKSKQAVEDLVNGGELTTRKSAGDDVSNITRKGGKKEAFETYEKAVGTAGLDPGAIEVEVRPDGEFSRETASDGTEFIYRTISRSGETTVEIQIERPVSGGPGKTEKDSIKVRFEE